jgi:drug/metabolite transporter (DMT)-like permease
MPILVALALIRSEPIPPMQTAIWAVSAGVLGALGIAALYKALSLGDTALVAPVAAVISATLPVLFSSIEAGLPPIEQGLGFFLAMLGIWLLSKSRQGVEHLKRQGFILAISSGIGFGGFFILLAQIKTDEVYAPLAISRGATVLVALVLLRLTHMKIPAPRSNPVALLAGLLDTGGNIFYLLAIQFTRLDVVAVLASLYPAATVLLARSVLKEKVTRPQWLGVGFCLMAITLII